MIIKRQIKNHKHGEYKGELVCVFSVYSVLLNAARRAAKIFGAIFINKLDIRLFGYSISERARAPISRGKGTVQYLSIADGLSNSEMEWATLGPDFQPVAVVKQQHTTPLQ